MGGLERGSKAMLALDVFDKAGYIASRVVRRAVVRGMVAQVTGQYGVSPWQFLIQWHKNVPSLMVRLALTIWLLHT
jgi:hypothetical protein